MLKEAFTQASMRELLHAGDYPLLGSKRYEILAAILMWNVC